MRKCSIVLLILLPALLAACSPVAGVDTPPQPSATVLATLQPALTPGAAAAATVTIEDIGTPVSGATPALEAATPMSEPTGAAAGGPPPAVRAAIAGAAQQLGVAPDRLTLISYEAVDWPDACLGVVVPGVMCAEVITPGYRFVLRGPQGEFELHTATGGTPARILKPGTTDGLPPTAPVPTPQPVAPPTIAAPSNPSGASGIEGHVTIGPVSPATVEGQSNTRPYQATIDVLDQSGQVVTRFATNDQGLFRVALAPGTYIIHPESAGRFPFAAQLTVRVLKGTFVTVDVQYDSGIR